MTEPHDERDRVSFRRPTRRAAARCLVVIVVAILGVWWPVTGHDWVLPDDPDHPLANPVVSDGASPWASFDPSADRVPWGGAWQPVRDLSLALDAALAGATPPGPAPFLRTQLVLHTLNACLLFALLMLVLRDPRPSLPAALVWGLHPIALEAVAWTASRGLLLATFFVLLGLVLHRVHESRPGRGMGTGAGALAAWAAALLSHPFAVGACLLPLASRWCFPSRREGAAHGRVVAWTWLAVGIAAGAVHWNVMSRSGLLVEDWHGGGPLWALATGADALRRYLVTMAVPTVLHPLDDMSPVRAMTRTAWVGAAGAALLASITAAGFLAARRGHRGPTVACGFAALWVLTTLLPALLVPTRTLYADSLAYLPSVGAALVVGYVIAALWVSGSLRPRPHTSRRGAADAVGEAGVVPAVTALLLAAGLLLWFSTGVRTKLPDWATTRALYASVVGEGRTEGTDPDNPRALAGRARLWIEEAVGRGPEDLLRSELDVRAARIDGAVIDLSRAVIQAHDRGVPYFDTAGAHLDLARAEMARGNMERAYDFAETARVHATRQGAGRGTPGDTDVFARATVFRGRVLLTARGAPVAEDARALAREALEVAPDLAAAHHLEGDAWLAEGEEYLRAAEELEQEAEQERAEVREQARAAFEKAVAAYRRALRAAPRDAAVHAALAEALLRLGRAEEAETEARRALELAPDLARAVPVLGRALLAQDRPEEAAAAARALVGDRPFDVLWAAAGVLGQAGARDEALAVLTDLAERPMPPYEGDPERMDRWVQANLTVAIAHLDTDPRDPNTALHYLERAYTGDPSDTEVRSRKAATHEFLGLGALVHGDREEALRHFRLYTALSASREGQRRVSRWIGALQSGEVPDELRDRVRAGEAQLTAMRGLDALQAGDVASADRLIHEAIAAEPDNPMINEALGDLMKRMDKRGEAKHFYGRAVDLEPDRVSAWRKLAFLHYEDDEKRDALRCFEEVLERRPDDPVLGGLQPLVETLRKEIAAEEDGGDGDDGGR